MSVQAGIWNIDGAPVDRDFLARISQSLAGFGPDGEVTYFGGPVGMLYRPFHTTPEARVEYQPYISAGGKVITWDGRLDNRDELIPQLSHLFQGDATDVSIVAAALERWGTDCFAKLIGDWAIAVWDQRERKLVLARDYVGVKNLFYHLGPTRVIWCNHLAPLALCGVEFTLCEEYIAGYLSGGAKSHLTPYREIRSVASAHFCCIWDGRVSEHSYWTFNPRLKTRHKTDKGYEEHFRHLFGQAVRRRLRADTPILAELSGGLDSSSIVCMTDDILLREGKNTSSISTFSALDPDDPNDDDSLYVARVEQKRGREGYHAEIKPCGDTFRFNYPTFVPTPGFAIGEEFNTAQTDAIQRGNYRILFCGDGGDQVLGQERDPRTQMADQLAQFKLVELGRLLSSWSLSARRPWVQLLSESAAILLPTSLRTHCGRPKSVPWLNACFSRRYGISERPLPAGAGTRFWLPTVRESFQIIEGLSRFTSQVRPSLVEKRYPFLDQTLTEFLMSIPAEQLLRPGERRSLLRRALVNVLPKEILSRQSKASSGRCYVLFLQKHWKILENILLSPMSSRLGYIDQARLQATFLAMKSGHVPPNVISLLGALSLELWLREAAARGVISIPSVSAHEISMPRKHSVDLYAW